MTDAPLSIGTPAVVAAQCRFRVIGGLDSTGATPCERPMAMNASGQIIVVVIPGVPAGNIVSVADVAIAGGVTTSLDNPNTATTRTMFVQNTASGSTIRVREVGSAAGVGTLLQFKESRLYSEAVERIEAECIGATATTVGIQYETT